MGISDFISPFLTVAIVGEEGRFPLWAKQEGTEYSPLMLACVQSVTIEMDLGQVPTLTANLAFNRAEGQAFIESPLIQYGQSHLEIQIGYAGGSGGPVLSPVYTGLILKPEVGLGDEFSITMKATGLGGYSALRSQSARQFVDRTRYEILSEVLSGVSATKRSLQLNVSAVRFGRGLQLGKRNPFTRQKKDSPQYKLMFEEKITVSQGYFSDWAFTWKLVQEARCSMLLHNDVLYVFALDEARLSKPVRELRYFDFPGGFEAVGASILPILSVNSPTSWIYLPQSIKGIVLKGVNRDTLDPMTRLVDDNTVRVARTAKAVVNFLTGNWNPPLDEEGEGGGYHPGNPDDEQIIAAARGEYDALTDQSGMNLTIETLFDPMVHPGVCVRVSGVSKKHDGIYGVQKVTYEAGGGVPTMSLECIGNWLSPDIGAIIGIPSEGTPNTSVGTESSDYAETSATPGE